MKVTVCPFCEVVSAVPHHTQRACIDALQEEIARTRQVLEQRTQTLIADSVTTQLGHGRSSGRWGSPAAGAPRLYLRCAIDR